MLKYDSVTTGMIGENCYLVWDDETKRGLIIDPGDDAVDIISAVHGAGFVPEAVLLTHAHFDHIGAVAPVCREFSIPAWCHADDLPIYNSPDNCMEPWFHAVKDLVEPVKDLPVILKDLGGNVIHTPGHTPGGCCFHFRDAALLFSGDTLFCGGVGRTDFPGGSSTTLWKSIREKLFVLPPKTLVLPGHEASTTIEAEKH